MSIIRTRKKRSRSKRSGQGIDILNYLETVTGPPIKTGLHLSTLEKLMKLHKKFPKNRYYKRLINRNRDKGFNENATTKIDFEYYRLIVNC